MKGLAKKNNKTRGKTTHKKKNNKKTMRKVKIRGGRREQRNDYHEQDDDDDDAYIVPNEPPPPEQHQEQLAADRAEHIRCPHDDPTYRDFVLSNPFNRMDPRAKRYEDEVWEYFNQSNDIPEHLKDNKELWMDICHNARRRERNGGKKRKTHKKRK